MKEHQAVEKTFLYYQLYESGISVKDIAKRYSVTIDSVIKELDKHPLYKGLPDTKVRYQTRSRSEYPTDNCQQVKFYCPKYLEQALKAIPGTNRRAKLIEAIEDYLASDNKKLAVTQTTGKDKAIGFLCPKYLIDELDSLSETKVRRSRLIIAAIEMFIAKNSRYLNNGN